VTAVVTEDAVYVRDVTEVRVAVVVEEEVDRGPQEAAVGYRPPSRRKSSDDIDVSRTPSW
jgi:hypothetical protein